MTSENPNSYNPFYENFIFIWKVIIYEKVTSNVCLIIKKSHINVYKSFLLPNINEFTFE